MLQEQSRRKKAVLLLRPKQKNLLFFTLASNPKPIRPGQDRGDSGREPISPQRHKNQISSAQLFVDAPLTNPNYFLSLRSCSYFAYRVVRMDCWHWVPFEGTAMVIFSVLERFFVKVIVDFTGIVQFRCAAARSERSTRKGRTDGSSAHTVSALASPPP